VVRAILELSGSLGLEVVAEGIENEEQADVLRDLGCGLGQGFWLCRPQEAATAFAYLAAGPRDGRSVAGPRLPHPAEERRESVG
jgi:EAL domain-containing protein (putative c-di-GMP-specific phosphodiesterase class I)